MTKNKQITTINNQIKQLQVEIKKLDLWFIANISHKNWNQKINQYWNLQAKVEELTLQRNRINAGKHRLKNEQFTHSIPNINLKQ